jgi:cyclopropane-fatty-acyl-phospholipid synthase
VWAVDGTHYSQTLEAWLERLDADRERIVDLFVDTYGRDAAVAWYRRWRVFNLACSELFAFDGGSEWHVTHTRMRRR